MKKKKKLIIPILFVTVFALIGIVLAYLFTSTGKDNEIKVTNADIIIDEEFDKSNLKEGYNVYKKTVPITNKGENPCFVRVFMDFSDSAVIGEADSDIRTYFSNDENKPAITDENNVFNSNSWKLASSKEWLNENWIYIDYDGNIIDNSNNGSNNSTVNAGLGGYYYYKLPVEPDESTEPLISWVMTYFKDADKVQIYDILLYTETIQTIGIDGTEYVTENNANWIDAWKAYLHIGEP